MDTINIEVDLDTAEHVTIKYLKRELKCLSESKYTHEEDIAWQEKSISAIRAVLEWYGAIDEE